MPRQHSIANPETRAGGFASSSVGDASGPRDWAAGAVRACARSAHVPPKRAGLFQTMHQGTSIRFAAWRTPPTWTLLRSRASIAAGSEVPSPVGGGGGSEERPSRRPHKGSPRLGNWSRPSLLAMLPSSGSAEPHSSPNLLSVATSLTGKTPPQPRWAPSVPSRYSAHASIL